MHFGIEDALIETGEIANDNAHINLSQEKQLAAVLSGNLILRGNLTMGLTKVYNET